MSSTQRLHLELDPDDDDLGCPDDGKFPGPGPGN